MIELIQTHEQINGGEEYLGFARQKLSVLNAARQATNLPIMRRVYEIGSARITVVSADSGNQIRIEAAPGGFICHPRDKTNPGGTLPGGVAITPAYIYPLVDDDLGSQVLTFEDQGWLVSTDVENYGNLYWIGGGGDVLSWRGPSGRQFEMDSLHAYPGFTEWDYTEMVAGLEVEHYTPYRNFVYQNGEVLKEFLYGYKVLGCALNGGSLVCVIGVDYAGKTNPDGGTDGFFDEVWMGDEKIGWQHSSRPTTPWFFNASGTEAICKNQKLVIAEDVSSCTFVDLEAGSGTQNNLFDGTDLSSWGVTKIGSWPMFRDFNGIAEQGVMLSVDVNEQTNLTGTTSQTYDDLSVMISGEPVLIGGYPYIGRSYSVENMCPNVVFSAPCLTFEGGTVTEMEGCCADITIRATDEKGNTASATYSGDSLSDLVMVGSEAVTVGANYGLSGIDDPRYPISWSFNGGTIDSNGQITTITGCGMGSVTGTDACGRSATMAVRLPSGVWVQTGTHTGCSVGDQYCGQVGATYISGNYKAYASISCGNPVNCPWTHSSWFCPGCGAGGTGGGAPGFTIGIVGTWYSYEWRCP